MIINQAKSILLPAVLALTLSQATMALDVAGLRINDSVDDFQNLMSPAKQYLTVTHDPEGRIVRIFYQQEGLPNDSQTQKKLVNRICDKYGRVTSCYSALSEIKARDKKFLRFFHLYRDERETQELRARIRRTKMISLTPELTVEIDLIDSAYAKKLKDQKATASDLIDF
ncbi:MAG TPA: hypothetical protein DEF72_03090 [Gammaproteobacteria bacterium]|nr:hypothetical protein [Gammaproteobacteria bacterium]HBX26399.1 hypothetical protein [Gammaproteobacteria bacterium]|tara:strand:+ start:1109 stop:1618 length:510 start_codon:yes stop_codon:yes gene_type:complete